MRKGSAAFPALLQREKVTDPFLVVLCVVQWRQGEVFIERDGVGSKGTAFGCKAAVCCDDQVVVLAAEVFVGAGHDKDARERCLQRADCLAQERHVASFRVRDDIRRVESSRVQCPFRRIRRFDRSECMYGVRASKRVIDHKVVARA